MAEKSTDAVIAYSPEVSGLRVDRVLLVTFDNPPVNAASQPLRAGLMAALEALAGDDDLDAMVLTGAGKSFVGGADIKEFGKPPAEPALPVVVEVIEASRKPVVAALNGVALGGGLELALAAHARIAHSAAKVGLPEVKLGIVPGAGGTQRLPRLTGVAAALEMIATGRLLSASEALQLGILDAVVADGAVEAALEQARGLAGSPPRRTGALAVPASSATDVDAAEKKALSRARGQVAPGEAVRLVKLSATVPFAEGLAEERRSFLALKDGEQAAALRHVFFAERAAAKVAGLEGVVPRKLETIGVAGTGLMGCGIAVAALDAGFGVIAVDQSEEAAAKGRARIDEILKRNLSAGRIDEQTYRQRLSRLFVSHRLEALAACDLVVEAVFDDVEVKAALFVRLDAILRPNAIIATNTSYLDPDVLAARTVDPSRVVGLHFFSPANVMRLMEVVRGAATASDVLATGLAFAKRLGKLPVVCGVAEGFIGNRIFSAYRRAAEFLVEDGSTPADIDQAMEGYGMAMGPFAVFDLAGLEIAWARRKRQAATRDPKERYSTLADRLCEAGRFGQKSRKGWYAYPDGRKQDDPDVAALIQSARADGGISPRAIAPDEIVATLLSAMAAEGQALLAEGIATRPGDIDLVLINGYGFPAYRGGPMFASAHTKGNSA